MTSSMTMTTTWAAACEDGASPGMNVDYLNDAMPMACVDREGC